MALRRLYALLTVRCGWTLDYIRSMRWYDACWHMTNLDHLGREDQLERMAASGMIDNKSLKKMEREWKPWREPIRIRKVRGGKVNK